MAVLGSLLQEAVKIKSSVTERKQKKGAAYLQNKTLLQLLKEAQNTEFGKYYDFGNVLYSDAFAKAFQNQVPVFDYNTIYNQWWHKLAEGQENICWPGKTRFFALTSGTSEASSKMVPITKDMIRAIRRTSLRQLLTLSKCELPKSFYQKSVLMLGGSISLNRISNYSTGDLSGILASKLPIWFQKFYKPGKQIAREKDWNTKLEIITQKAKDWDIVGIAGVPAWVQILLEKIIDNYKVKNIHDIWPNFKVFVHGGVSFEPYKKTFASLLGQEIIYLETYLASEGFLAYQDDPEKESMKLVTDNGIFFEFIPFNEHNFAPDGQLKEKPEALLINEVQEGVDYALLISTCAGVWRYLIGDTIRFTSVEEGQIIITGRTKHFLSLCGEHLSVDNMNHAIEATADELNLSINEYTVTGIKHDNLFAHKWFVGTDKPVEPEILRKHLDEKLMQLNDDYKTERSAALKEILVHVLPVEQFYQFMKYKGKEGGQNKFPRVMKGDALKEWEIFLQQHPLKFT